MQYLQFSPTVTLSRAVHNDGRKSKGKLPLNWYPRKEFNLLYYLDCDIYINFNIFVATNIISINNNVL